MNIDLPHADSGLQLLGHRYYDPSTGRFLTRDPITDGRNWYAYCENNPLKAVDPEGLLAIGDFDFTWEGTLAGLTTGVHGLASGMTFGIYDGGDHKNEPGFGFSKGSGMVASVALIAVAALELTASNIYFYGVKNGLGGASVVVRGKAILRVEIQQWAGKGQPWWQYPHYHRGPKWKPHRPWQDGW